MSTIASLIEEPFTIDATVFNGQYSTAILYVPSGTKTKYEDVASWNQFANIVEITKQCEAPTIEYNNGILKYNCTTEDAECISYISDSDIKSYIGNEIDLSATYQINVYASAIGYKKSDVVTATLCWIDSEPKTEGITNSVSEVNARAVLIQNRDGIITVSGTDNGQTVYVYSIAGQQMGSAMSSSNTATIKTNMKRGDAAIIRIGNKGVKVILK